MVFKNGLQLQAYGIHIQQCAYPKYKSSKLPFKDDFNPFFSMCASAVFAEFFSGKIIHGLSVTASRLLRDKSKIER